MYLFIIFSIVMIFCFVAIIYASKNENNCNCDRKTTPEYSQPTPKYEQEPMPKPIPKPTPDPDPYPYQYPYPYPYRRSPYLQYDPLYNLYSISPISSLYTYLVEDHPHGFIERGPRGRSPRERCSSERGPIGGNVIQNFNIGNTGGRP